MLTKYILFSVIIIFFTVFNIHSQQDYSNNVHRYIVGQAWEYLKHHKQSVNWNNTHMTNHIGTEDPSGPDEPWAHPLVISGAAREDEEDPIYEWGWPNTTSTHFWDADFGDTWKLVVYGTEFQNAYQKARIYAFGKDSYGNEHTIYIKHTEGGILGKYYTMDLINLYNTGQCIYYGYRDGGGNHWVNPQLVTLPTEQARGYAYIILGRIAHLLMDQSVPAHAHGDTHAWPWTDGYEDWMGENNHGGLWNSNLTPLTGARNLGPSGIIDVNCSSNPIRYLFYLTNQVADRFSSDGVTGDSDYDPSSYPEGNYSTYLGPIYHQLEPYIMPEEFNEDYYKKVGDYAYCFSIKAVASLMWWFAYNTHQFPLNPPPQIPVLSTNLINNFLYRGQSAYLNVSNLGNTSYPCYEWRLYKCQADEQHFASWPVDEAGLQTLSGRFDINFRMRNNNFSNQSCAYVNERFFLNYWVDVRISNGAGVSQWSSKYHIIPQSTNGPIGGGGGCPYIFTLSPESDTSNFYKPDNNILHRSEFTDFANQDIRDLYLIQNSMSIVDDKLSIIIQESEPDYDYFDQVKLIAVDHPIGTIIGISESNDIVMYDSISITSPDNATLNGISNITPYIQYNHITKNTVKGFTDDSIYAHYSETAQKSALQFFKSKYMFNVNADSLALIGEIGYNPDRIVYPVANKDYVGTAVIYADTDTYTHLFARRENSSTVIIPFSTINDAVEYVDINWNSDYEVGYFSVVPIAYTGFTINDLTLLEATHTLEGDVMNKLVNKDSIYAEIDTTSILILSFSNISAPLTGMRRDYVFETNGRYVTSSSMNSQKQFVSSKKEIKTPYQYKLHLNYPNPFNPKTMIKYDVGKSGIVKIGIYNLLGQLVQSLVNEYQNAGNYSVEFDGTNLASGMYLYKMEADSYTEVKKMVLIK